MKMGQAFIIQVVSTLLLALFQLLSIVILSRLIETSEFGYIASASGAVIVGMALADVGFGSSIVRKRRLTQQFVNSVLTLALSTSLVISLIVFLIIIAIWQNPKVITLAAIFGAGTFLMSIAGAVKALLQRERRYWDLFIVNGTAYVCGMIFLATLLAWMGFGAYAIAWGQLLYGLVMLLSASLQSRLNFRFHYNRRLVKPLFLFGSLVVLNRVLDVFLTEADKLIMPKLAGFEQSGFFERISRLSVLAGGHAGFIVDSVLYPDFCRAVQRGDPPMRNENLTLATSTIISVAFIAASAITLPLITLMLGDRYVGYASALAVLLMGAYLRVQSRPLEVFFRAIGQPQVSALIKVAPAIGLFVVLALVADQPLVAWAWAFFGAQVAVFVLQALAAVHFGAPRRTNWIVVGLHCPLAIATMISLAGYTTANDLDLVRTLVIGLIAGLTCIAVALSVKPVSGVGWGDIVALGQELLKP